MHEIGTEVTYNKLKYTVIGYKKNLESLWYKIKPINSTSHHYTTTSGKHFTNIIPKKTLKVTSVSAAPTTLTASISTKYETPDELKSIYTPTITSKQSIGTIGLIIIGYIIYKLIK